MTVGILVTVEGPSVAASSVADSLPGQNLALLRGHVLHFDSYIWGSTVSTQSSSNNCKYSHSY